MHVLVELLDKTGILHLTWGNWVMFAVGGTLIWLAIVKKYEPLLLVPIGFGALLANLPLAEMGAYEHGIIGLVYRTGIRTELLPPIIFLGVGVLTDFRPLLQRPLTFLLGAAAQLGIFTSALGAVYFLGFDMKEAASIGIIGGADGPTCIYLTAKLAPRLLGANAIAAYSYMAMVPLIQPPIMKLLTSKKERQIVMKQLRPVSKLEKIYFPMIATLVICLLVPDSAPLMAMLMLGNLFRECGVVQRLSHAAQNELLNIVTIFLGIAVGTTMKAETFLNPQPIFIFILGLVAFSFSTMGGLLLAKFFNLFLRDKINPLIGSAGQSAVPMAARVTQRVGQQENPRNFLLMHAMGPNVAGVIGTATAAGMFLAFLK